MKSNNQINNPEAREAMDKFKMEAAQEVGVDLKQGYNGPPDLPRGRLRRRPDGHEDDSRPTREACKQSLSRGKKPAANRQRVFAEAPGRGSDGGSGRENG